MKCLICEKDFEFLGRHVSAHEMTAKEYKEKFHIPLSQSLTGSESTVNEEPKIVLNERCKPKRPMKKYAFINRQMKARADTFMSNKSFVKDWHSNMQMFWLAKKYATPQSSLYRMESLGYLPPRHPKRTCQR